jgi:hypothetical protein
MHKMLTAVVLAVLLFPSVALAVHRDGGPAATQVAAQICGNLQQQLGTSFASTYGSVDQCGQQLTGTAQTIVDECTAKGQPGTDAYRQCIQAAIAQAVQQAVGSAGVTTMVTPSAAQVAGDICGELQMALGTAFSSQLGSPAGCAQKLAGAAQTVIAGCASNAQPGTAAFKQCMDSGVASAVRSERAAVAKQICTTLKRKLGVSAFAKKYGSLGRCEKAKSGV